jgi:hypothetical protein
MPPRSSWGLWGDHDVLGCLNLLTPERALRAAQSIRSGKWFPLNLPLDTPNPPVGGRPQIQHRVTGQPGGFRDDVIDSFNTQSSSQWDGFRHFPHRSHGSYGGVPDEEHGVHHWAARGIVGRCVLIDLDRWRTAQGRPLKPHTADPVGPEEIAQCIQDQATPIEVGDVLLLRTGWTTWYRSLSEGERMTVQPVHPGPAGKGLPEFIWNLHISAIAADNYGCEMFPATPGWGFFHSTALPLLGLPIGELWDLDALAEDCAATGAYDSFFTSSPLYLRNGAGSPPNAIAIR